MSNSTLCDDAFVSGSDICGPGVLSSISSLTQVRWGLFAQMGLSLFVSLIPRVREDVVISFGTGALVTGVALLATGFIQGQRQEIAFYQQAIIVQMAGMGFGPAVLAWLKRGHGKPDTVFFAFTILYAVLMTVYLIYNSVQGSSDGPIINCFLDQVPKIYGKRSMKIINSVVVGLSISVILLSMHINWFINARYHNGSNDYSNRRPLSKWYTHTMVFVVFAGECVLAASVEKTIMEYGQFVSNESRAAYQAWQFGQIVPFMMLLQPLMEGVRALMPKVILKREESSSEREGQGEVGITESPALDGKSHCCHYFSRIA